MIDNRTLHRALHDALAQLLADHQLLFKLDVNERSLTHWLAVLLAQRVPSVDVDCEYNRDGDIPKRLVIDAQAPVSDSDARSVFPDIIVHERGTTRNYLVIEAKKTSRAHLVVSDRQKLAAYMAAPADGGLGYAAGALVVFQVGDRIDARIEDWLPPL